MKTQSKTDLEKILVINHDNGKEYFVKARMIKDYNLTPSHETVAWNGTLLLYVDNEGQYYLWHHTGNSAHRGTAIKAPEHVKDLSPQEALEWVI